MSNLIDKLTHLRFNCEERGRSEEAEALKHFTRWCEDKGVQSAGGVREWLDETPQESPGVTERSEITATG